jgi:hypothetical protein
MPSKTLEPENTLMKRHDRQKSRVSGQHLGQQLYIASGVHKQPYLLPGSAPPPYPPHVLG